MYIDRNRFEHYSFTGQFYTLSDDMPADGDILDVMNEDGDYFSDTDDGDVEPNTGEEGGKPDAPTIVETVVLETKCDIQETDKMMATSTAGSYLDIFFPINPKEKISVRIGHRFRSNDWNRPVDGRVYAVIPSPMGGCKARIKEVGIDES